MAEVAKTPDNNVTIGLVAAGFPLDLFQLWEEDCKENFGNHRWVKIWQDHLTSRVGMDVVQLIKAVESLQERVFELERRYPEQRPVEDKESVVLDGSV